MTDISLALYRKYRPSTFEEVRNQEHIISVLKGAVTKKMIPHALLFVGSRGTGKTTVARIFARAIGAHDVDIYEIDAASNRGIDDIRALRDAVHTMPFESPYKVYIIDEVHMLTKEAFNALLKTLEEPPAHVIFILATTERDKLLDTITSRCQVFEFRAPSRDELRDTVMAIAQQEHFTLDASSADVIALSADGSYRDALGITQKVMMASGDTALTPDEVATIVGAPKAVLIASVFESFVEKDAQKGLEALRQAATSGVDMKFFMRLLLERVRTTVLLRYTPDASSQLLIQYGDAERTQLTRAAKEATATVNSHLILRLITASEFIGKSAITVLPLELALIEHCQS